MSTTFPAADGARSWRRRLRRLARARPSDVHGLVWAHRSLATARRELDARGTTLRLSPPGSREQRLALPVLEAFLRVRRATCLERTYVVQSFLGAHGVEVPVVIGVRTSAGAVEAHAWLEGYDPVSAGVEYREITRVPGPTAGARR